MTGVQTCALPISRVRDRIRKAKKNNSLQISRGVYLDTLSAFVVTDDMQDMGARQQQFAEMQHIFYSAQHDAASQEEAAARLGPSFRVS